MQDSLTKNLKNFFNRPYTKSGVVQQKVVLGYLDTNTHTSISTVSTIGLLFVF